MRVIVQHGSRRAGGAEHGVSRAALLLRGRGAEPPSRSEPERTGASWGEQEQAGASPAERGCACTRMSQNG